MNKITSEGAYPKYDGDVYYASEVNDNERLVGAENAGIQVINTTVETNVTSIITIPANTINTGLIIELAGTIQGGTAGDDSYTIKTYADGSNPPITLIQTDTMSISDQGASDDEIRGFCTKVVITSLTKNVVNYVKVMGKMSIARASTSINSKGFTVTAY